MIIYVHGVQKECVELVADAFCEKVPNTSEQLSSQSANLSERVSVNSSRPLSLKQYCFLGVHDGVHSFHGLFLAYL